MSTSSTRLGRARSSKEGRGRRRARGTAQRCRPVERLEHLGQRQAERVRRPVRSLDDRYLSERGGTASALRSDAARAAGRRHDEADALDAGEPRRDCGALAPPGSSSSAPARPATEPASRSSVTTRTSPTTAAASTTSPSIASATSVRISDGRRLLPPARNGMTTTTPSSARARRSGRSRVRLRAGQTPSRRPP